MTDLWTVKLTGPARRALEQEFPEPIAGAAYRSITERLVVNPDRVGNELSGPFTGNRAAPPGIQRAVCALDDNAHTLYVLSIRLRGDVYGVR